MKIEAIKERESRGFKDSGPSQEGGKQAGSKVRFLTQQFLSRSASLEGKDEYYDISALTPQSDKSTPPVAADDTATATSSEDHGRT